MSTSNETTFPNLFDWAKSQEHKKDVLDQFEATAALWLATARRKAVELARPENNWTITTDDVQLYLVPPPGRPKLAGAIFRDGCWDMVGTTATAKKVGHGRRIGLWQLKPEYRKVL